MKRRIGILLLFLCLSFSYIQCYARAASTENAVEPIMPEKECTLTISYRYHGTNFLDVPIKLYKIAEVSADYQYTLTKAFADAGLVLNGIRSAGEWNVVRSTLEAYILAHDIQADRTAATNMDGQVCFEMLETGMYLAVAGEVAQDDLRCYFASSLVALPGLGTDGYWQYQVEVLAKAEALPPVDSEETLDLKVLKLWKGDEDSDSRPNSVEIEIFRNGVSYETVALSQDNNWCYQWEAKDDGASWMVVERNIPAGYTMTVEVRESSFVVTNTWDTDDPPIDPPHTGDTFHVLLPILLLGIAGSVLLLFGVTGKRSTQ